jgi:hypothetical protein
MGHRLEDVKLGRNAGLPQRAMHAHSVGEEKIAGPGLQQRRRQAGKVTE